MTPPTGGFLGISWADAAIIAAVISGVFVIVKEGLSFGFRWLEESRQVRRRRLGLYARVLHDHFQMGVGATKALGAWRAFTGQIPSLPGASPQVGFLLRFDNPLATEVLQLTDESPETVTAYLHGVTLRDLAGDVLKVEKDQYGAVAYDYPRTRNVLRTLLEHAATSTEALANRLPGLPWWREAENPMTPTLQEVARNAVANFRNELQRYPAISGADVVAAGLAAAQQLRALREGGGGDGR